jgi:predicted acyl esterase
VQAHTRDLPLTPGEPVVLDIEIWPSGTRFAAGERLRVLILGRDPYVFPKPNVMSLHEQTVNRGRYHLHTGGRYDSHLLVPEVP